MLQRSHTNLCPISCAIVIPDNKLTTSTMELLNILSHIVPLQADPAIYAHKVILNYQRNTIKFRDKLDIIDITNYRFITVSF